MKFKQKKTKQKWWFPIVAIALIAIALAESDSIISKTTDFLLPIRLKVYQTNKNIHEYFSTFSNIDDISQKIKNLELQIKKQDYISLDNKTLLKENQELRELLQMKERTKYEMQAAEIIYIDSLNPYETITINKGSKDGIEHNMAVISTLGLVGRIKEVFPDYSIVELVTSPHSFTSAINKSEDSISILTGQGNDILRLEYVVIDSKVAIGNKVFTSGISNIYPKGLPLGTIESITDSDEIFKEITVKLPYNIFNLKSVMVMKKINEEK